MNFEIIITAFVGFAAGSITPVVLHFLNRRNQTNQTNAEAISKIAQGGETAVNAAIQLLNEYQEDNARLRLELSGVRTDLFDLRVQEQEKEKNLFEVIEALKAYIKTLIDTLRAADIEIPPRPDILKESNPKIKAVK
jgi:uncharacterized membrane protein